MLRRIGFFALVFLVGVQQLKAQTVQVQVTVVTASPLTNVYFAVGTFFPGTYEIHSLGSLPASTAANPDVSTVTVSDSIQDDYGIVGLYTPGGVTASTSVGDAPPTGKTFEQFYGGSNIYGVESDVAAGIASGDMGEIYKFMSYGVDQHGQGTIDHYPIDAAHNHFDNGHGVNLFNFSTGSFDGSATAVALPEPSTMLLGLLAALPLIAIRRRKFAN